MNKHIYFLLILFNKNYNKHFLKRYVKLALFFKERNFKKAKGLHFHHLIPDSFDGAKSNENMVYITPREHFILHWMLYKAFPKSSMVTAFFAMCSGFGKMDFRINSKVYENLALEFVGRQSETGRKNAKKQLENGTHNFLSKEFQRKNNLKRVADGTHNFLGGEIQRKMNKKRVDNGTHPFSEKNKRKIECPHCKRILDIGNYNQWHGDKCKLKLEIHIESPQSF